jgi:uncharacterized protein YjiS (DUF1127 family)
MPSPIPAVLRAPRIGAFPSPLATLLLWLARARGRRRLAELDARELDDVGVEPAARDAECRKRFWEA